MSTCTNTDYCIDVIANLHIYELLKSENKKQNYIIVYFMIQILHAIDKNLADKIISSDAMIQYQEKMKNRAIRKKINISIELLANINLLTIVKIPLGNEIYNKIRIIIEKVHKFKLTENEYARIAESEQMKNYSAEIMQKSNAYTSKKRTEIFGTDPLKFASSQKEEI